MNKRHKHDDVFIGRANGKDIEIKIWVDESQYIRADIVDELEDIRDYEFSHRYIKDITNAALAKLEESHD